MKDQQFIERGGMKPKATRHLLAGRQREAIAVKGEIKRGIAMGQAARHRMVKHLTKDKVLEEIAPSAFCGSAHADARSKNSASASARRASSTCSASTILPSIWTTPLPWALAASKAAMILRAAANSSGVLEKIRLAPSIWLGWIKVLPSKP